MDGVLCDELLEEVLRRLPWRVPFFASSTADVSLVSKRGLRLYRSTTSTLSLRLSPDNCTPHSLSYFLSHFPCLSSLSITIEGRDRVSSFPDQILLSVASSCPKLTHLCLQPEPVSRFPLLSLSTSCPRLTSLDIALPRPFCSHWLRCFHSLKNLNVSFLSVPQGFEPVDAACEGNFDGELKLETLHVSGIRRGDHGLNWLWKSCKNLKKLQLNRCDGIGDDTSRSSFVKCLKGLREVELIHCRYEILSKLVNNCASLSALLVHDTFTGTKGLRQFITHSRCNLRKLDLRTCRGLPRENYLLAVGEKFRGLLSLRLHGFFSNTDEGLKTMMLAMSNEVEELALVNCNLGPGLLTTLGQKFRNLRKLDLSSNRRMLADEESISCNFLTELKVRSCRGLTNASLASMFKSCKQLESVDIMDCPGIEAEYVEFFLLNCPRLRQICVEESKLSDVSRLWASKKLVELVFR
ncbi:hypothetical protein RHMOL_Rhmol08G0059600 [Rhododendron molle]|uniref:Uncharacterized protein n=1 Tax=Rhododendron molle TaxID=49168 RepID=A0ACC0MLS0_RHOML|nr:hypothetical protein RHMOL_Rhmol08G0059600 [Rhododendron molle]